jgi:hypothetical protein
MAFFKPSFPYSTAAELLIPSYSTVKGTEVKSFPVSGIRIDCSFKTYGGMEAIVNDLYSVIDTATVETWFRPDIKPGCRIRILQTGDVYEIVGKPENINLRNQFCKFRVRAVEGGA